MPRRHQPLQIAIDTGGTFTDCVWTERDQLRMVKVFSTPADPSQAIVEALEKISLTSPLILLHGTTVGTNTLLQRRGARVALVTTAGFEDVIEIGRQARPELYNLNAVKPAPLVASDLRFGVHERIAPSGEVLESLGEEELENLSDKLRQSGCEAIAVSLLFSFAHPEHEKRIARALEPLGKPVSISHQILPEYREYERTSTVTVNAYLQPLMGRYLNRLTKAGPETQTTSPGNPRTKNKAKGSSLRLRVMQSSGGSISAGAAAAEPVRTILSGPAGGVVGALQAARVAGFEDIITFDMGGTST